MNCSMKNRFVILVLFFASIQSLFSQTTHYASTFSGLTSAINAATSGDIIEIQNDLTTTTPATGFSALVISKTLTINGNNYTITVPVTGVSDGGINNSGTGGTSTASAYRVLNTTGTSVTITINDWVIKGGNIGANGSGGCILNSADKLVLNNVTISNGRSSYLSSGSIVLGNGGGGMSNTSTGRVYMQNCMITRNSAGYGGGFLNDGGKIFLEKTTFTENRSEFNGGGGGGCETKNGGFLYFNNCTFSNNYSTEYGGAINNYNSTTYVANSTFTGNVVYGSTSRGAAISNRNGEYVLNCIFAYNYYRSGGTITNPSAYDLDDFGLTTGTNVNCYNSIYHSGTNKFNTTTSTGNVQYTGAIDGSDNSIFAGGIYTKITDGTGTEIGSAKVYQPLLVSNVQAKTATLKLGSFPNKTANKGLVTGFTFGGGSPSMGYKNTGGTWVNILGTAASSNIVTLDQLGTTRSTTAPTRGSVETEIATVYMLKSVIAANGTTLGASIYGDVYASGTKINVTAIANTGYAFSSWIDYTTGSVVSTSNPYSITLTSNLTIQPVFVTSSTYTVTFSGNNNTSGSAPNNLSFTTGNSVTLSGQGTLLRDEYYFSGWNTQPSGGGTNYAVGATYSTTANLTLYAKWTPYVKYYVKSGFTAALNSTSSWSGYPDGTGGSPANFNSDKIFILDNSANSISYSTGGNWTIAGALQIPTGKTLSIDNNTTLSISGDIFNSGSISSGGSGSILKMAGSGSQYLAGNNTISKLVIDNSKGVNIGGATDVTNSLTLTNGVLGTSNGTLTLKSNSSGTAIVNQVTGGSISGVVTVERYIPARRAFRLLSSPVTTTTSINVNWQEGGSNASGLGTHITGSSTGSNGFDQSQTGNNSLFTHNNATGTWSSIGNTNSTTLTSGNPYRLMVRGDRTVDLNTNTPTPRNTTLRATGTLFTGSLSVSGLSQTANGFSFIGNPYQAPVDMNTILTGSTNLNKSYYYIWDPKVSTRGAYVTVDVANNSNNVSGSTADKYLQPWQACFVKTVSNGSSAMSFTEASKGSSLTNVFKLLPPLSTWNIQLYQSDSLNVDAMPNDGFIVHFDSKFSNTIDQLDALKPVNQDENLAVKNTDKLFSIESRNIPEFLDTIPLYFYQIRDKKYVFKFDISANVGRKAFLIDKYLNLEYPIENVGITSYSFEVDLLNNSSKDPNRFVIVFKEEVLSISSKLSNSKYLSITPNPVKNNRFKITNNRGFELGNVLEIIDMNGKIIYKKVISLIGNEVIVDVQDVLSSGVYCVKFYSENSVQTKTLIIE